MDLLLGREAWEKVKQNHNLSGSEQDLNRSGSQCEQTGNLGRVVVFEKVKKPRFPKEVPSDGHEEAGRV